MSPSISDYHFRPATNDDIPAVKELVFSVLAEFGLAPSPESTDVDLDDLEANYFQAGGTFEVVATSDGRIVGCAGLQPVIAGRVELRKMYLRPEVRGKGLGRTLLQRMLTEACRREFDDVVLETNHVLGDAIRLYERYGFRRAKPLPGHISARCDCVYHLRLRGPAPASWPDDWDSPLPRPEYGVPRRFSVGTLMLVAVICAVFFGILRALGTDPIVFVLVIAFFAIIGLAQAVLFRGKHPRRASVICGMTVAWLVTACGMVFQGVQGRLGLAEVVGALFCFGIVATSAGALAGYLAGVVIAGVFLVGDGLKRLYRRRFAKVERSPGNQEEARATE